MVHLILIWVISVGCKQYGGSTKHVAGDDGKGVIDSIKKVRKQQKEDILC